MMTLSNLATQMLIVAQAQQQPSFLTLVAPWLLVAVVFYFIWFVPERKRQRAKEEMLEALKKGDRVVTQSGIYGKVIKAEEQVVVLEIADNVRVRVTRSAIAGHEGSPKDKGER